ncbi:hypothetical protein [Azospirillum sp. BE72]|uniref:hypothetical protein n=1 Tax=Azospirillum sp. BE72 TaxID=2817776 RepID=UPI0028624719|nr:hypothetical protein [Azospirillum sp. BE72]MDR6774189.1 hypothetical protein [Azospirillum sp. BE72]
MGMHKDWPIHRLKTIMAGQDIKAAFQKTIPALKSDYGAPRDEALIAEFLREQLPAGRYAIYGAGTLGGYLFGTLSDRPGIIIQSFLDKRALQISNFCGRSVVLPDEAANLDVDGIIVMHHHQERSMIAALRRSGVPDARIVPAFSGSAFIQWALQRRLPQIDMWRHQGIEHLVVTCADAQWSLLRDAELASHLPPDRTLHAYFGRSEPVQHKTLDTVFPMIDLGLSLVLLDALVSALSPRTLYVKVSAHYGGQFLGAYLKARFPDCLVIQEMYDQALMLTDEKLRVGYDYDANDIARIRIAELASMQICDLVITKNGGHLWDEACRDLQAPQAIYFPRIEELPPQGNQTAPGALLGVVFAGTLPRLATGSQGSDHPDMRYVEMVQRIELTGRVFIDLYNAAHRFPGHDAFFAPYREVFGPDGYIRYHSGLPFDAMKRHLSSFHFGWHVMHNGDPAFVEPVSRVGIGNKFTTYLNCGLPILIDPDFEYMADLVSSYDAGLVVGSTDLDDLEDTLLKADHAALLRGVQRLTDMMRSRNSTTHALLMERLNPS